MKNFKLGDAVNKITKGYEKNLLKDKENLKLKEQLLTINLIQN